MTADMAPKSKQFSRGMFYLVGCEMEFFLINNNDKAVY